MNNEFLMLSGISKESVVDGEGIRYVIYTQGCKHNCPGCHNKETHDFNGGKKYFCNDLLKEILSLPYIDGVTFSGGDPLEQAIPIAALAKMLKARGLNIWCYTGYTYEYILENMEQRPGWSELMQNIDVLVDGKFIEEKKDLSLNFRGSSNQKIIEINNEAFYKIRDNSLIYYTVPAFTKTGLVSHAYTTRHGGVSIDQYASLNMNYAKNDSDENVYKNIKIMCDAININWENVVSAKQVHGDNIVKVIEENKGIGTTKEAWDMGVDGLITNCVGLPLKCYSADCVLITYLDPVKKVVGIAHSGWKGTVAKIGAKMVKLMKEEYNCDSTDILVAIGPSISGECFEIEEEVLKLFENQIGDMTKYMKIKNDKKYNLDLWEIIRDMLINEGIKNENITISGLCTKCDTEQFFSYRGMNGRNGSLASIIEIKS